MSRITTTAFRKMKSSGSKITVLTAYDYPTAKLMDECGVDAILVGDSLGMVVLGYQDTTQVTMEDMLHHIKAVTRAAEKAMVIADMPFLSYHTGLESSVRNAGRMIQEGRAQAVKLEGGREVAGTVRAITNAGIPVMGHIGLTPQHINSFGGYYIQGKTVEQAKRLIEDAKALEEAGAFSVVLECVPAELAEMITGQISIPTIGIGAGKGCSGQVLVINDILGLYQGKSPSFAKSYAEVGKEIRKAVSTYVQEVKAGVFPGEEHSFAMSTEVIEQLYGGRK